MKNIPDPVPGASSMLVRPPSGVIEDTKFARSNGNLLIVLEARKAAAKKPLVIVSGGPMTTIAEAYLLDPSIAEKVVVASHEGGAGDAGGQDPWANYIVLKHFRLILLGSLPAEAHASVPKARIAGLPQSEFRDAMLEKTLSSEWNAAGAFALLRGDYCLEGKRKSFGQWLPDGIPGLVDDPNGRAWVITAADGSVATREFWRALENPAAW